MSLSREVLARRFEVPAQLAIDNPSTTNTLPQSINASGQTMSNKF